MKKTVLALFMSAFAVATISGCASRPDSIPASFVSESTYIDSSCSALHTQLTQANEELRVVSDKQNTAANVDAGSVFLALIPVSAFTGDHEAEVAEAKGKVNAIKGALAKNKCMN